MAHNPHAHLQREIDSLRKQLIQERDQRRFDDSLLVTTTIKQAEERTLERCIVECMEEANAPTYTEEERVAILTATERLKEMRSENVKVREEEERIAHKRQQEALRQRMMEQMMQEKTQAYDEALKQALIQGASITSMVMDESADVRWSNISNPKEWLK
jgi:hypothetical protein